MRQADEICAHRLDHPHVLIHLRRGQRKALVLPHVVPAHTREHQPFAIEQEFTAANPHVAEAGPHGPLVFAAGGAQRGPQTVKVRCGRRPEERRRKLKCQLHLMRAGRE